MRVAVFSPVWFPVPPNRYGGIEAIVQLLADGLVEAGVDVTLFASGDSVSEAPIVSAFDTAPSERIGESYWELQHLLPFLERRDQFDIVHDHSGLVGLTMLGLTGCPTIHTVHGPLTGDPGDVYRKVCSIVPHAGLISLTHNQRRPLPDLPWLANVPNAVDVTRYPTNRRPGDALLFLGRMSPDKGAHRAIRVAKRLGRPLDIAAKCREPAEIAYFDEFVAPHLNGDIRYVGEVDHTEKCALLASAHALIVPIEWEEPFGLVMIEALASGTPVVAMRRGSVPEILRHGETAFIANDLAEMIALVDRAAELDPARLRQEAETRFTVARMVEGYLQAYETMIVREPASVLSAVA
ncbi:MAG: glycosyltransferase family 4 protein [Thermoleophilia bacterium]|nr:glycosyltransferase family 4 protein [Thermoleophilia bacterium]